MTEELKQKAEEWLYLDKKYSGNFVYERWVVINLLVEFATVATKELEKQNKELQEENEQLVNDYEMIHNCFLIKENEVKELQKDNEGYEKDNTLLVNKFNQTSAKLIKAKEIIRDFISVAIDYIDKEDKNYSYIADAEQFLKETK